MNYPSLSREAHVFKLIYMTRVPQQGSLRLILLFSSGRREVMAASIRGTREGCCSTTGGSWWTSGRLAGRAVEARTTAAGALRSAGLRKEHWKDEAGLGAAPRPSGVAKAWQTVRRRRRRGCSTRGRQADWGLCRAVRFS